MQRASPTRTFRGVSAGVRKHDMKRILIAVNREENILSFDSL